MTKQRSGIPCNPRGPPNSEKSPCQSTTFSFMSMLDTSECSSTCTRHRSEPSLDERRPEANQRLNIDQASTDNNAAPANQVKQGPIDHSDEEDNKTPRPPRESGVRPDKMIIPSVNALSIGRIRERITIRDGILEELDEERFYETIEPCGIRHLPRPRHLPNGLLAAINLIPFADDMRTGDRYFEALGTTLVTNDA